MIADEERKVKDQQAENQRQKTLNEAVRTKAEVDK